MEAMQPCNACKALEGCTSLDPPHIGLVGYTRLDMDNISHGQYTGSWDFQHCVVCRSKLMRNADIEQDHGGWAAIR